MEERTAALVRLAAALALGYDEGLTGFRDEALRQGASAGDLVGVIEMVRGVRLAALLVQDQAASALLSAGTAPVVLQMGKAAPARFGKGEGDASAKPTV